MAREVRVDALALECGVPVSRVMDLLVELGQVKVRRVSQHIPEGLAQQVRQRVGASASAPAAGLGVAREEAALFAQAMSAAGVRPLVGATKAPSAKPPRPGKAAAVESVLAPQVPSQDVPRPRPPPSAEDTDLAPVRSAAAEVAASDQRLPEALARIVTLEARLAEESTRREALESDRRQDLLELAALRDALHASEDLAQRLADHAAIAPGQRSVVEALRRRGLVGLDEANIALRSLLSAHLLDGFLPFLVTPDGDRFGRILDERLCLCCGQQDCGLPTGVERITVPAVRCELCGGGDPGVLLRRFSDACLLTGLTRILLVGGRRWSCTWLEGRLDRRVILRAWPGELSPKAEVVEPDLAWAEIAILWGASPLGAELAATVQGRLPRATLRVGGSSLGACLDAAIQEIGALDPATLLGG